MEFFCGIHGKCPNPLWKIAMEKCPWKLVSLSSMENVLIQKFPWNSMEIDVLILHGIPCRFFTRVKDLRAAKFYLTKNACAKV